MIKFFALLLVLQSTHERRERKLLNFHYSLAFINVSLFVGVLMSLPRGVIRWSVISDRGIFWLYPLVFIHVYAKFILI